MKTKFSLAAKNALGYFALFLVTIGLVSALILQSSSRQIIDASEKNLVHISELASLEFKKFIDELKYDIRHISQSPFLYEYLRSDSEFYRSLLAEEYLSLLNSKPHFSQIRYISARNKGYEWVRVERHNGEARIVTGDELQDKSDREYYIETAKLPESSIYVSPIDLNKEFGKISEPHIPTLRVAYPVYLEQQLDGVIVINTDLSDLFRSLDALTDENSQLALLNNHGYYLYHWDKSLEFGFEFNKEPVFTLKGIKDPGALVKRNKAVFDADNLLQRLVNIGFPKQNYEVYILISSNKKELLASYYAWRSNSLLVLGGFSLLSLLLALLLMRRQVRELKAITETINNFPTRLEVIELPVNRTDEIGVLADSFNRMTEIILKNIDQLEVARVQAEKATQEKQEFLENMSHEIRNPIHSILGLSDLLSTNEHLPHQEKLIENIRLNTSKLLSLVTDVLDYRNILRGKIQINPRWNNLEHEMNKLHKVFAFNASVKNIDLKVEMDPKLNHKEHHIDIARFMQIVTNLLSNAIKYTHEGGDVMLSVKSIKDDGNRDYIELLVRDNGKGIEKDQLLRIRERYFRSEQLGAAQDGFGLGLSIVIGLLDMFGSKLKMESELGIGSCFSFEMDLAYRESNAMVMSASVAKPSGRLSSSKVLVIEDDKQVMEVYKYKLPEYFDTIRFVESASEFHELGDNDTADVIITDYHLWDIVPEKLGQKISRLLCKNAHVYLTTGRVDAELDPVFSKFTFLQKPFAIKDLVGKIQFDISVDRYGVPKFDSISEDYDEDKQKIKRALNLLRDEWLDQKNQLVTALLQNNKDRIDSVIHKMISSVRRLELSDFESLLLDLQESDTADIEIEDFKARMDFYIHCIQSEID